MFTITFVGWRRGLDKIKLVKLIREDTQMTLRKAHSVVDELLAGARPTVTLNWRQDADYLLGEARRLGADVEMDARVDEGRRGGR